ncbi:MAG: purine-nucleoside phosphorylase [Bacilli bacterium]|nr:purine-nucleoside phosphorylase [Bacilli bacterium]
MESTPHINPTGEFAKTFLMPGDPKRSAYIASKFLENPILVNDVRGVQGYTGTYKGHKVSVMASGMGIPSMAIYSYELFKIYDVDNIIRIGTSGANRSDIKLQDVILSESSFSLSTFAKLFDGFEGNELEASKKLNKKIEDVAKEKNINIKKGRIITSDVFNPYCDDEDKYFDNYPKGLDTLASEMESFALFYMAKKFNKHATCLLTVVDSPYDDRIISSEDRERALDDMILLALEAAIKED